MATKTVPAVSQAAIQAVQDPQVRQVLRSIADGLAVRNGDVGDGQQAFLTLGDLTKNGYTATAVANALAVPLASGVTQPGSPMFALADALVARILGLPEWAALFTRIGLLDAPDTTPGSIAGALLAEARSRGAAITDVTTKIQTESESRASDVKTITAALNGAAAAIQEETTARVKDGEATAQKITTLGVSIGNAAAAIQDESAARVKDGEATAQKISTLTTQTNNSIAGINNTLTVKTNNENALADAVNTMWAKVGSNTALIKSGSSLAVNPVGSAVTKFDQLQATVTDPVTGLVKTYAALRQDFSVTNDKVNGMSGTWSVKLDLNGYVSGMSLNAVANPSGSQRSNMLFNVDTFAIGAPGHPEVVPFAIDAKTGLVSIKGALVVDGSITSKQIAAVSVDRSKIALKAVGGAQIDDLAVGTLQIAGNSVTVGTYAESGGNYVGAGGSANLMTSSLDLGDGYNTGVMVSGVVSLFSDQNATYGLRIYVNGRVAGDVRGSLQGGYPIVAPCSGFMGNVGRNVTVTLQAYNPAGVGGNVAVTINSATMSVMGGKR